MAPRTTSRTAAVALAAALCVVAVPASGLQAGDSTTRRGDCTGASAWALKVRIVDADTLRVRLVIAGGASGDKWNVFMDHNDDGFFAGSRVSGEGGLVVVRRLVDDLAGQDRIKAGALDTATGEECRARASL